MQTRAKWWVRCLSAHPGVCTLRTHHTFTNERVPLQSTTRAPLAPQISFDVPTSAEPEHSTPRKLACALPFSVDNPAANAKWWRCSSAHSGVCAPRRLCTPASAHPGVCALITISRMNGVRSAEQHSCPTCTPNIVRCAHFRRT